MPAETYARYDYAWKTAGWSVQNPSYAPSVDSYVDPGLGNDIARVHLFGRFLDFETGRPLEGVLRLRTSANLVHQPTQSQVLPGIKRIRFTHGEFSLYLPATDDPDLTPEFLYEATLTVQGRKQEFKFSLPSAQTEVNILTKVPNPNGSIEILPSTDTNEMTLGAVPDNLTLNLVTGADFTSTLEQVDPWPMGAVVSLLFGSGQTWVADLYGKDATFSEDKQDADQVPDGTPVRLSVSIAGDDEVWAVGRVVRHG